MSDNDERKVISIRGRKDLTKLDPHMEGRAVCVGCQHRWQAVAPAETVELECPNCHLWKGIFDCTFQPEGLAWTCGCGCQLFTISEELKAICIKCAAEMRLRIYEVTV